MRTIKIVMAVNRREVDQHAKTCRTLTPQQGRIARLLALGKSREEICAKLRISGKTLDVHLSDVKQKLAVDRLHQIPVVVFAGLGLLPPFTGG